jgi:hypothetical protein
MRTGMSALRTSPFPFTVIAAATPAAWPRAMHEAWTRKEAKARRSAERQRQETSRFGKSAATRAR